MPTITVEGKKLPVSPEWDGLEYILSGRETVPDHFIRLIDGHFAIGRDCLLCNYGVTKPKERRPGRGWGFRWSNKLRGQMIRHIREAHADLLGKRIE